MQPRINISVVATFVIHAIVALSCSLFPTVTVGANTSKVVVRDNMSSSHKAELIRRLRNITGWHDLNFNEEGFLIPGLVDGGEGSKSAQNLLAKATAGNKLIVIEEADARSDVAFCRVVPGRIADNSPSPIPIFVILIDFQDFQYVTGDTRARAAFDVGWGLLHELDHVVNDSEDGTIAGFMGGCEQHINQMRRELGLPIRATYFFNSVPARTDPNFITRLVRLGFVEADAKNAKIKKYWLVWDASLVGGTAGLSETALLKPSALP